MSIEDYIKNLSPELQEQARSCGSVEEIMALAREERMPVPDEILKAVAGGDQQQDVNCKEKKPNCPYCGLNDKVSGDAPSGYYCSRCNKWFDA